MMSKVGSKMFAAVGLLAGLATYVCTRAAQSQVSSGTILNQWKSIKAPPPPALKPTTVSPVDTALLLLDFNGAQNPGKGPCSASKIPRCIASVPKVAKLLAASRTHGVYVIYSIGGEGGSEDIATALTPQPGDPVVKSGPNKFIGTDLDALLTDKGIRTVIVTGTAAEGAVLNTASFAALTGRKVIVPVDGMSSQQLYAEQYVAWHLTHAPVLSANITLTKIDLITFQLDLDRAV